MRLWELKIRVVKYGNAELLRFESRRAETCFDGKPYRDLDIAHRLDPLTCPRAKAQSFLSALGFATPLPISVKSAVRIFSLKDFPDFEIWEAAGKDYTREQYQADLRVWWTERSIAKTHEEAWTWLKKAYAIALGGSNLQDRAVGGRCMLRQYEGDKSRLDAFYREREVPESIQSLLVNVKILANSHFPERVENKKKLEKTMAEQHSKKTEKTKGRKRKVHEGQSSLF